MEPRIQDEEPRLGEEPLDPRQSPARERFGFLLAMSAHRFRSRMEEKLELIGLQLKHIAVLSTIQHFGPVPQQRLGESVCIDRTSMVGLLDEMERQALVRRQPDPDDRRAHLIHLTESGGDMLRRATEMVEEVEDACLEPLSGAERAGPEANAPANCRPCAWSGFEHINIKLSGRATESGGRAEVSPGGGGGGTR